MTYEASLNNILVVYNKPFKKLIRQGGNFFLFNHFSKENHYFCMEIQEKGYFYTKFWPKMLFFTKILLKKQGGNFFRAIFDW
jgi:hypothetical protein